MCPILIVTALPPCPPSPPRSSPSAPQDVLNFIVAFDGCKAPFFPYKFNEGFVSLCGLAAALISIQGLWPEKAVAASASPIKTA